MASNIFLESAQHGAHFYMYRTVEIRNFKILKKFKFLKTYAYSTSFERELKGGRLWTSYSIIASLLTGDPHEDRRSSPV